MTDFELHTETDGVPLQRPNPANADHLRDLLGAESGDQWVDFMDYVNEHLADVLKRGAPSAEAIKNTFIGQAGFDSWTAMIESPVANGGLGWKKSAWNSWRKAFLQVRKFEYLREVETTASHINTVYRETKPDFPAYRTEWDAHKRKREVEQGERQQKSLKAAQEAVAGMKDRLEVAETNLGNLKRDASRRGVEHADLKTKYDELLKDFGKLEAQVGRLNTAKTNFKNQVTALKNRGVWARLINS